MGRDVIVIAGATGRTVSIVTNDLLHEQIKDSAAAKPDLVDQSAIPVMWIEN